ncbi:hypothetical protein Hdeb2414_s0002g00065901 [Helianthus debilis subsp. tardiflorus]
MDAPNLSYLFTADMDGRGAPQMNLASCKKLTAVFYYGDPLPNLNGFTNFLYNFPFLRNLFLATEYKCNNLKLSIHSLRMLVLHSNHGLDEIELNTRNLGLFIHTPRLRSPRMGNKRWSLVRDLTHLRACMKCYPNGCIDALWFQKLRLFLDKNNRFKVFNLYIHVVNSQKFTRLERLKAIEVPPYELEHV